MTHLTQVDLDYKLTAQGVEMRNGKRLRLSDAYDWHQLTWELFHDAIPANPSKGMFAKGTRPEHQPRIPADFLTRLDERPEGFRLLIVSVAEPIRPAWCSPENWRTRPIPEDYFTRKRYAFQLRANPTKKLRAENSDGSRKKNGRRVPIRLPAELADWLHRKASASGFAVETVQVIPQGHLSFSKSGARGVHAVVDFRGILQVTDAATFHRAFTAGLGSAKAFGFGLLVIAPVSSAD